MSHNWAEPSKRPRAITPPDSSYYRDYHAFWKLYGIDLPDVVLKTLYDQNALTLTPGLPQTGWPR